MNKGTTDLKIIYFDGDNISTYILCCMSLEDLNKYKGSKFLFTRQNLYNIPMV